MSANRFTVAGAQGFIGRRLVASLEASGEEVAVLARGESPEGRDLGRVIWCAGVTSDFRERPLDTVDAHVASLLPLLRDGEFSALVYLSSTRVYAGAASGRESTRLELDPLDAGDLYNASKLLGEMVCIGSGRDGVSVARISNVYAGASHPHGVIGELVRSAVSDGRIVLRSGADAGKDYVHIDDVLPAVARLAQLAAEGSSEPIYNIATGTNISNGELADELTRLTGCAAEFAKGEDALSFPQISVELAERDLGLHRRSVLTQLAGIVDGLQ